MNLSSHPDRLGIVHLYGNPIPSGAEFYNKVKEYLDWTPSNLMIQVWNEPNNAAFGEMSATQCRDLIIAAAYADAGRGRLIGPAMSPVGNWQQFMGNAYADHIVPAAVHIYPNSSNWQPAFDEALKHADLANGIPVDPNKPVYITEMAFPYKWGNPGPLFGTDRCGPNYYWYAQAAYYRAASRSNVRAVIYHKLTYSSDQFDIQGRTYFIDQSGAETTLTLLLDIPR
jgi:hypothetical protein